MAANLGLFQNVAKAPDTGIYFITAVDKLIRFEIKFLEGNKKSIATIVDGETITDGMYEPQLNVFKDKLIYTKLWETEDYKYEYTKAVIGVNEELPSTVTLNRVYYTTLNSNQYVAGAKNNPFQAVIPYLENMKMTFKKVNIKGLKLKS